MALTNKLTNIANEIRNKTGKTDLLTLDEMASEIENLPSGSTSSAKITDGAYLFYKGARTEYLNELLSLCENINSAEDMFNDCENLTELDLSNLDTSNIKNMSNMCRGCIRAIEIDLRNCDTSNVQNMSYAFDSCIVLAKLNISNFTFDNVNLSTNMFRDVPANCQIIVKGDTEKQWVLARRSDFTNIKTLDELHIKTIEINCKDINIYDNNKNEQVDITYNGGDKNLYFPEEEGYTLSITGNATIDENGLITLNDNAQIGDKIIITAISTYDSSITTTKELEVVYKEPYYEVVLNNGQWVDSGERIDGNIVYKSDEGSFNVNNGKSIAIIKTECVKYLKLYIRSYAESTYDYTEAFEVDTEAIREKSLYTTKGKQSATNYIECIYELDGGSHTIQVMYSKDSGGDRNDDRGYFYIGEYN